MSAARRAAAPLALAAALAALLAAAPPTGPVGEHVAAAVEADRAPAPAAGPRPAPAEAAAWRPEPAREAADAAVGEAVGELVDAAAEQLGGGRVAVAVRDRAGRLVASHHADRPALPASLQKMVTAAVALDALGSDRRLVTAAVADGEADGGVVDGDLVLLGGGDPALATPAFADLEPDRPRTDLDDLAAAVAAAGVRRVDGDVVGDASELFGPAWPVGWPTRYEGQRYAAPVSGLTVDAGLVVGDDDAPPTTAADPAARAAEAFVELLDDRGVTVDGRARAGGVELPDRPEVIAEVTSPPVADLVRHMLVDSDNHLAEALWRLAAEAGGVDDAQAAGGLSADHVAELGAPTVGLRAADGSGLSRDNRLSAGTVTALDVAMRRSPMGAGWTRLLPEAGREGTLADRFADGPARGAVRAKTGSLRDVRSLAGVAEHGGDRYHFAVLADRLPPGRDEAAQQLEERLAERIVEALRAGR